MAERVRALGGSAGRRTHGRRRLADRGRRSPGGGGAQQHGDGSRGDVAAADRPLRVVLVDDQPLVRAGIAFILSTEPGIEVVVRSRQR